MKIHSDILKRFVKKASLNGKIQTINLDFSKDYLLSSVNDTMNTVMTKVSLHNIAFVDYTPLGELYIKDTIMFMKFLDTFKDDITISLNEDKTNLILSSDKREVEVILGSDLVCDNVCKKDFPAISYTAMFDCNKEALSKTASDYALLKANSLMLTIKDNVVKFTVGKSKNEDSLTNFFNVQTKENIKCEYGESLINVINVLDGDLSISLGKDIPIFINERVADSIKFDCIIAPIVSED